jgi:antitoxin (DNA-binding transcriptional repressor) of toxin-antitoxin stability system
MAEIVVRRLRAGDVVTVKGSFGSRMAEIVKRVLAGEPIAIGVKG